MDKPIVIGVGEYLWDILPTGKKAGGAPVNFAYHASQHGAEGWAISAIGDDALGQELEVLTREYGINMEVAKVDYPTGTVKVELHNGQPNFIITENVAWDHFAASPNAIKLAGKASALSFGTLAQRHEDSRCATRKLISCLPKDALVVYDINLRQHFYNKEIVESSLKMANVFKINDEELEIVKQMFGLSGLATDEACEKLRELFGLKILILTAGDRFSSVYSDGETSFIPTPKVKVVDSVGAGDSFSGSFIASILSGKTIREAHHIAVETAAYVCTQSGAWTPAKNI